MKLIRLNLRHYSKQKKGTYKKSNKESSHVPKKDPIKPVIKTKNQTSEQVTGTHRMILSGYQELVEKYSKDFNPAKATFGEKVERQNNIQKHQNKYITNYLNPDVIEPNVQHHKYEYVYELMIGNTHVQIPPINKCLNFSRNLNQIDKSDHFQTKIRNIRNKNYDYDQLSPNMKFLTLYRNSKLTSEELSVRNWGYKIGAYGSSFMFGYGIVDHIHNIGWWYITGGAYVMIRLFLQLANHQMWHFNHAQKISKVDLMLNWKKVRGDNISRHLKITMKNGTENYVGIDHIQPVVQTSYMYSTNFRRKMNGTQDYILIKCEDEIMQLKINNSDFAINEPMLRAALNGYCIDMEVPCQKYEQDLLMGTKLRQMQEDFKNRQNQYEGIDEDFTIFDTKSTSEDQESGSDLTQSEQELSDDQKQETKQPSQ